MSLDAIFFDAGGTLVFPDPQLTLAALSEIGRMPTQEQLYAAERDAKRQLDDARAHGSAGVDARYWQLYYDRLLNELQIDDVTIRERLVAGTRAGINWRVVRPGTRQVLERLRKHRRLGVISNSDGSIQRLLEELGLVDCFDSVIDSFHAGAEKPDPRIFRAATESLGAAPGRSLYVGDIYSVDFVGARSAGLQALLMDPAGVYADTPYPRVTALDKVEHWLGN
jgi:HAD superfamily hydrolase (TIGR01509 family)